MDRGVWRVVAVLVMLASRASVVWRRGGARCRVAMLCGMRTRESSLNDVRGVGRVVAMWLVCDCRVAVYARGVIFGWCAFP